MTVTMVRTPNTYFQNNYFRPHGLKVRKLEFGAGEEERRGEGGEVGEKNQEKNTHLSPNI